jgi:paraquat-inducible protein B
MPIGSLEQTLGPRSPLWDEVLRTSQELAATTRALRLLVEYLERHPDALIRGKPETQP